MQYFGKDRSILFCPFLNQENTMLLKPSRLGNNTLSSDVLSKDKKDCLKIGPCGIGKQALYLGNRFFDRFYYLSWNEIRRVFKRVAMSPGGFSGKGIFGSISYLVVQYGNGQEYQCRFKIETDIDRALSVIAEQHPHLPTHSRAAEKKLMQAKAKEEARYLKTLSPAAAASVEQLTGDLTYLNREPSHSDLLSAAARQKRIIERMPASYRIAGACAGFLGIAAAIFGVVRLFLHAPYGLYFIIGGAALFFMTLSANLFPNRWNSRRTSEKDWSDALTGMRQFLPSDNTFSVPVQYAHPVVLERMIRVIREGKTDSVPEALRIMKEELRAINSDVTVSQEEYNEVTAIKPLFLVCDYRDEI